VNTQIVVSEVDDHGVVWITLDRPEKKNALSIVLRDEVSTAFDRLGDDPTVRVIVITGSGTVFCAGFDLLEFADSDPSFQGELWRSSDRFHHTILRCPVPVLAAVNGAAIAGGFDLAVLADLRVAADTAHFAHVEHTFASVLYRPLRDLIGGSIARELVLTGRTVDAHEALSIGLVSQVVPADQLPSATAALARTIASAPREVLMQTKAKIIASAAIDRDLPTLDI
jgi:enoyl-CoA hydratase/carnithine racemase